VKLYLWEVPKFQVSNESSEEGVARGPRPWPIWPMLNSSLDVVLLKQWSSTFFVKSPPYRNFTWKSPPTGSFCGVWKYYLFWK